MARPDSRRFAGGIGLRLRFEGGQFTRWLELLLRNAAGAAQAWPCALQVLKVPGMCTRPRRDRWDTRQRRRGGFFGVSGSGRWRYARGLLAAHVPAARVVPLRYRLHSRLAFGTRGSRTARSCGGLASPLGSCGAIRSSNFSTATLYQAGSARPVQAASVLRLVDLRSGRSRGARWAVGATSLHR